MDIVQTLYPFESTFLDFPDNHSEAVIVFFCGCDFKCPKCQNPDLREIWPNDKTRKFFAPETFYQEIKAASDRNRTKKVVFSGGDPLAFRNRTFVREFLRDHGSEFEVVIYTGYSRVEVLQQNIRGFKFLKCGTFDDSQQQPTDKTDEQFVLASRNQEWVNSIFEVVSEDGVLSFSHA